MSIKRIPLTRPHHHSMWIEVDQRGTAKLLHSLREQVRCTTSPFHSGHSVQQGCNSVRTVFYKVIRWHNGVYNTWAFPFHVWKECQHRTKAVFPRWVPHSKFSCHGESVWWNRILCIMHNSPEPQRESDRKCFSFGKQGNPKGHDKKKHNWRNIYIILSKGEEVNTKNTKKNWSTV